MSVKETEITVKGIEAAITKLPVKEVAELTAWLVEYNHSRWDEQIADDLDTGRLDAVLAEVDKEYEAGLSQPL